MQVTIAAGVLTSAAAVAGLAVLGWGVAATSGETSSTDEAGPEIVPLEEAIGVAQQRLDGEVEAGEMTFITSERTTWHEWYEGIFGQESIVRESIVRPIALYTPQYPCNPDDSFDPSCNNREVWKLTFHGYIYLSGNDPNDNSYDVGGCRELQVVVGADKADLLGETYEMLDRPFPDGCAVAPPKPEGWP